MANRIAVAAGGTTGQMVDGNGLPICAGGGGAQQCIGALEPGDVLVDGNGNPIGGGEGSNTAYAPGSVIVATGNFWIQVKRLQLTTTQRLSVAGTGRFRGMN